VLEEIAGWEFLYEVHASDIRAEICYFPCTKALGLNYCSVPGDLSDVELLQELALISCKMLPQFVLMPPHFATFYSVSLCL
jgi:hypothetical protein